MQESVASIVSSNAGFKRPHCRLCHAPLKSTFADLGMQPLRASCVPASQLGRMEPYYPLHALVCDSCFLVQLLVHVPPNHAAEADCASPSPEHARAYCQMIKQRLRLGAGSLVVEVAGHDGHLLPHFLPLGVPGIGIEPAAFGGDLADQLVREGTTADLIIANDVLARVSDLGDFVAGLQRLLAPDGVVTLEFPHLRQLLADNRLDSIRHEHAAYFSLVAIDHLAERHGLKVIDVEEPDSPGGSLRVYLAHAGSSRRPCAQVNARLEHEIENGLFDMATYARFAEQARRTRRSLLSFLIACKEQGKRVCGYGATGQGNALLNACGIGANLLDFTVDRSPSRHGRFTPGTHIPVLPVEAVDEARPDYLLILPFDDKDEIIQQMRHVGSWGCRFIVPLPDVRVIDPNATATILDMPLAAAAG